MNRNKPADSGLPHFTMMVETPQNQELQVLEFNYETENDQYPIIDILNKMSFVDSN